MNQREVKPDGMYGSAPTAIERGQLGAANNQYADFPSPVPNSPLKESPLIHYPPIRHYGAVVRDDGSFGGAVRNRAAGFKTSDQVYAPFYQNRISYPPTDDLPNSLAPLTGVSLYHAPVSMASMKVRMGLYEKEVQWKSHLMDLSKHDQLSPSYCNLNPRATLPTLTVDGRVTTDDKNCLYYINKTFPGIDMVPESQEAKDVMDYFIDLIDRQNVECLAFGEVPSVKKVKYPNPFPSRRRKLNSLQNEHANNHNLTEIYKVKELINNYQEDICCNPTKMMLVFGNLELCLSEIEYQLSNGPFSFGGWLVSDRFTLADIHALCMLKILDMIGLKSMFAVNTLRYYQQGNTRKSLGQATDDWMNPFTMWLYTYIPNPTHRIIFFICMALLLLALFGLLGWGIFKLCSWLLAPAVVVKVADPLEYKGLRADVVNVVGQSVVEAGTTSDWMKWTLLIFPLMLLVPLFLWFFGCLKCKKRAGRPNGTKPRPARINDEPHVKSRSNSISSIEDGRHSDDSAVLVTEKTTTETQIVKQGSDIIVVHEEVTVEKKPFSRSMSDSSSLQKIVVVEEVSK